MSRWRADQCPKHHKVIPSLGRTWRRSLCRLILSNDVKRRPHREVYWLPQTSISWVNYPTLLCSTNICRGEGKLWRKEATWLQSVPCGREWSSCRRSSRSLMPSSRFNVSNLCIKTTTRLYQPISVQRWLMTVKLGKRAHYSYPFMEFRCVMFIEELRTCICVNSEILTQSFYKE